MSLWFGSLTDWGGGVVNVDAPREQQEKEVRHILTHLAMTIPKEWWERAISRGTDPSPSHVLILKTLQKQLKKLPELANLVTYPVLVALPFTYSFNPSEGQSIWEVWQNSTLEALLNERRPILQSRPDLQQLGTSCSTCRGDGLTRC